jgi:hypothetical protein
MTTTELVKPIKGYLVLSAVGTKPEKIFVSDAAQAVAIWNKWRDSNRFGGSDLKRDSGNLVDDKGKTIAKISYNGKIWDYKGEKNWTDKAILLYDPYAV